jgi:hypothetical protein
MKKVSSFSPPLAWISQTRAGWDGEPGRCRTF